MYYPFHYFQMEKKPKITESAWREPVGQRQGIFVAPFCNRRSSSPEALADKQPLAEPWRSSAGCLTDWRRRLKAEAHLPRLAVIYTVRQTRGRVSVNPRSRRRGVFPSSWPTSPLWTRLLISNSGRHSLRRRCRFRGSINWWIKTKKDEIQLNSRPTCARVSGVGTVTLCVSVTRTHCCEILARRTLPLVQGVLSGTCSVLTLLLSFLSFSPLLERCHVNMQPGAGTAPHLLAWASANCELRPLLFSHTARVHCLWMFVCSSLRVRRPPPPID